MFVTNLHWVDHKKVLKGSFEKVGRFWLPYYIILSFHRTWAICSSGSGQRARTVVLSTWTFQLLARRSEAPSVARKPLGEEGSRDPTHGNNTWGDQLAQSTTRRNSHWLRGSSLNKKAFVVIELTGCTECNVNTFTFLSNNHDLTMNLYMKKFIFDIFNPISWWNHVLLLLKKILR